MALYFSLVGPLMSFGWAPAAPPSTLKFNYTHASPQRLGHYILAQWSTAMKLPSVFAPLQYGLGALLYPIGSSQSKVLLFH